jgi:hypothetical protein
VNAGAQFGFLPPSGGRTQSFGRLTRLVQSELVARRLSRRLVAVYWRARYAAGAAVRGFWMVLPRGRRSGPSIGFATRTVLGRRERPLRFLPKNKTASRLVRCASHQLGERRLKNSAAPAVKREAEEEWDKNDERTVGPLYTIRPITQPRETSPQSVVSSLARVERQVRRCAPH